VSPPPTTTAAAAVGITTSKTANKRNRAQSASSGSGNPTILLMKRSSVNKLVPSSSSSSPASTVIRAATFEHLIVALTSEITDEELLDAFLVTLEYGMRDEFLALLQDRFDAPATTVVEEQRYQIKIHVCSLLKYWLSKYWVVRTCFG
jgi:hypothetical protein